MKTLVLSIALLTGIGLHAQQLIERNGVYCTANGEVFTGEYTTFYPHGTKAATYSIHEGLLHKHVTYYRDNGTIEMTGSFHRGKKDGIWRTLNEQGELMAEARFKKGDRVGEWVIKDPFSNNAFMLYYAGDKLINSRRLPKSDLPIASYR